MTKIIKAMYAAIAEDNGQEKILHVNDMPFILADENGL